jgi:hypothetical protein
MSKRKGALRMAVEAASASLCEAVGKLLKGNVIATLCRDGKPFPQAWQLCCDKSVRTPRQGYKRF